MLEQFRAEMERFMRAIKTIIEQFAQGQLTGGLLFTYSYFLIYFLDRVDDAPSTSTSSGTGDAGSGNSNDAADGNNGFY